MSPAISSHSMVLATAMALSGTVILFALRLQKSPPPPPSCIISQGDAKRKKKKRVHFAEDVVDPIGNSDLYRKKMNRYLNKYSNSRRNYDDNSNSGKRLTGCEKKKMPENRVALYNGILRDRVCHSRLTCSY